MKIFPSSSIKKLDAYTIENEPITSIDLMERAATVLTKAITDRWNTETPVTDRKSTRLNSSHWNKSRMPSSA